MSAEMIYSMFARSVIMFPNTKAYCTLKLACMQDHTPHLHVSCYVHSLIGAVCVCMCVCVCVRVRVCVCGVCVTDIHDYLHSVLI